MAIKLDREHEPSWYNGPPYAVLETVFDKYDMDGCEPVDERVSNVRFEEGNLLVTLFDERNISVPVEWYPRLHQASAVQLTCWENSSGGHGIHWPMLDEDLSIQGLLRDASKAKKR